MRLFRLEERLRSVKGGSPSIVGGLQSADIASSSAENYDAAATRLSRTWRFRASPRSSESRPDAPPSKETSVPHGPGAIPSDDRKTYIAVLKDDDESVHRVCVTARLMVTIADQRPGKYTTAGTSRRYEIFTFSLLHQACVACVHTRLIGHCCEPAIVGIVVSNDVYTAVPSTGLSMVVAGHFTFAF